MFENLKIMSHFGPYEVIFRPEFLDDIDTLKNDEFYFIVDQNIANIYQDWLANFISEPRMIIIEASEEKKSIGQIIPVFENLVARGIKRNNKLVAIGGGVVQDITCFIASVLFRGLDWCFVPTTLLAQADSCIGSKSSVNLDGLKNALGTFNPPKQVWICPSFLNSLDPQELKSGIGEIIKVHAIDGPNSFDALNEDFDNLERDSDLLLRYISASLLIKKRYIEIDEFDRNERNIFNYGHSFGHAIESATNFKIPHGIAVSIGMNMANNIAVQNGLLPPRHRDRMKRIMYKNYLDFREYYIPVDDLLSALANDKKNTGKDLTLILPVGENAEIKRVKVPLDDKFKDICGSFLRGLPHE